MLITCWNDNIWIYCVKNSLLKLASLVPFLLFSVATRKNLNFLFDSHILLDDTGL